MVNPVPVTQVVYLNENMTLQIGSSYQSDLFYQFNGLVPDKYATISYVNQEAIFAEQEAADRKLEYGEEIRVFGLWIKYLKDVLLIFAYEGDLRLAVRERRR